MLERIAKNKNQIIVSEENEKRNEEQQESIEIDDMEFFL